MKFPYYYAVCLLAILVFGSSGQAAETDASAGGVINLGTGVSGVTISTLANSAYTGSTIVGSGVTNLSGGLLVGGTTTYLVPTWESPILSGTLTKNGANTLTLFARQSLGRAWSEGTPELSGRAENLEITTTDDGDTLRIKTTISVSNKGGKVAKNVTADVYLSDDAVFDVDDTRLASLKLSDFFSGVTNLRKNETLDLPIRRKVPMALAGEVAGKYLVVILHSDSGQTAGPQQARVGAPSTRDINGSITGLTISNPGVGYTSAPTVTITGGTGSVSITGGTTNLPAASVRAVKITAGSLVLNHATGYVLPALTAAKASTFRLDSATVQPSGVTALPGGTLQIAATGATVNCALGTTLTVEPGDVLSLASWTSLTAISNGKWTIPLGQRLLVAANATLTTLSAGSPDATPKNEVVIGPIKLP